MPCLLGIIALALPRLVLVMVWLFGGGYLGRAYQTVIWPVLGFFFLPLTTLAYAFAFNNNGGNINGGYLVLMIFAVLIDLGLFGDGAKKSARRLRR